MKLSKEDLAALIVKTDFMRYGERMTLCVLTLVSGFEVVGKSACLDAANFDADIGKQVAYDDAFDQLWELEGYYQKRLQSLTAEA